ncbi:MAG: DUF4127 family protein [Chloroflexi bacterium CFX4]|nr:DUF4127 family protein [Chloroflexi bacterium CFX4]MDL1922081.1 DUF4127 family protein [Chloroflexi bacterium CFX3]
MTHLALIPLDERPVNTRYPRMIAQIAGAELSVPPPELLSAKRAPADRAALAAWLNRIAPACDALIISLDMLAYGGLIASRTTADSALSCISALDGLRALPPRRTTYAFNVITRIPDANDSIEEPDYWAMYGKRLHRYSQLMHRAAAGEVVEEALSALHNEIPEAHRTDFLQRRLRNHQVNLAALDLAAQGMFDLLVISSDDTSPYGLGSQEKAWLSQWRERLELGDSVLMYPGADEIGCVLTMRALLHGSAPPRFYVHYAIEADKQRVAPYEDGAVSLTVERQIRALDGVIVASQAEADFIVAVNPPSRIGAELDFSPEAYAAEQAYRAVPMAAFASQIAAWLHNGQRVILCDVAYPNGSDPFLMRQLFEAADVTQLAAYGAWNTAGNTIGTALAQGVASAMIRTPKQAQAQQHFLAHRFVEDYLYQQGVRAEVRAWLAQRTGIPDSAPHIEAETCAYIERALSEHLAGLPKLGEQWRIAPNSVRLPWQRTFEIDFDLEAL